MCIAVKKKKKNIIEKENKRNKKKKTITEKENKKTKKEKNYNRERKQNKV
jgi:hypothetical protein